MFVEVFFINMHLTDSASLFNNFIYLMTKTIRERKWGKIKCKILNYSSHFLKEHLYQLGFFSQNILIISVISGPLENHEGFCLTYNH